LVVDETRETERGRPEEGLIGLAKAADLVEFFWSGTADEGHAVEVGELDPHDTDYGVHVPGAPDEED
jgi:hypothetical protein